MKWYRKDRDRQREIQDGMAILASAIIDIRKATNDLIAAAGTDSEGDAMEALRHLLHAYSFCISVTDSIAVIRHRATTSGLTWP